MPSRGTSISTINRRGAPFPPEFSSILTSYKVRRIQMNFRPASGYDYAVNVFRAFGIPITDRNMPPPASQGSSSRPVSSWSGHRVLQYPVHEDHTQMKLEPVITLYTQAPLISHQPVYSEQSSLPVPTIRLRYHSNIRYHVQRLGFFISAHVARHD